jgi:hypothetical protein
VQTLSKFEQGWQIKLTMSSKKPALQRHCPPTSILLELSILLKIILSAVIPTPSEAPLPSKIK